MPNPRDLSFSHTSALRFRQNIKMDDERRQYPDFPFPFEPYNIQEKFMRTLYDVLEEGKGGIFESPTGTVN